MDKQTFSERTLAIERRLYCVARTYLREAADCADCVQEAILKAWTALPSLRREEFFETWLTRIVINECRAALRAKKRLIPVEAVPETRAPEGADTEIYEQLAALPEKYRVVAVMHYAGGYTLEEIADSLHLPLGTVKNRLFRARQRLKMIREKEACGA